MKRTALALAAALLLSALLLPGCDRGSKIRSDDSKAAVAPSFEASIPYDGQDQVPISAYVILFFNEAIDPDSAVDIVRFERATDAGSVAVPFRTELGSQSIAIHPTQMLVDGARYRVRLTGDLTTVTGDPILLPDREGLVEFRTRADRPRAFSRPELVGYAPSGSRVRDFSTFHLYFSEPLDGDTIQYGSSVKLLDADEELVPCRMLANRAQIVLDPFEDLTPSGLYTIVVTDDIRDLDGSAPADPVEIEVTPIATRPHHPLVVEACPSANDTSTSCEAIDPADLPISRLTGAPVNSMITTGKVLGESRTYLSGPLFTVLGESKRATADQIPVVIRAGQTINTTNIEALLGGEVPSGLETGEIQVTLLTDAVGYIEDSTEDGGVAGLRPRVKLIMDAALNATDPQANASFSQEILGVELSGYSVVDDEGRMMMEVGGMSEIFVMGERVNALMTMFQVAPDAFPEQVPDTAAPYVMTTTPVDEEELVDTETPVIVQFSEPINPDTVYAGVALYDAEGVEVDTIRRADGGKVTLIPKGLLEPVADYEIRVTSDIVDIAGNALTDEVAAVFTTNALGYSKKVAPRVGSTEPANEAGTVFPMNFEPILFFTQDIERGTVVYGESVSIIDEATGKLVEATPIVDHRSITLRPAKYFTPGRPYRIELTAGIQNPNGVPLDADTDFNPAGPPFERPFVAGDYVDAVPLILHASPVGDRNGDGEITGDEVETPENRIAIESILILGASSVSGDMISYVYGLSKTATGEVYLDAKLSAGIQLYATTVGIDIDAILELFGLLQPPPLGAGEDAITVITPIDMGLITIDVTEPGKAPIYYNEFDFIAEMGIDMTTYFSVQNGLFNALLDHVLPLQQRGLLFFTEDGRMEVQISGETSIKMLGLLNLPSTVSMRAVSSPGL